MEVIARRKDSLLMLYGIITLIGLGVMIATLGGGVRDTEPRWFASGIVLFVVGAIICINILRTPKIIISFDGENLILPQGRYALNELSKVNYRRAHARGIQYGWGKLFLTIDGRQFSYNNVAEVETVHDRLMELRLSMNNHQ